MYIFLRDTIFIYFRLPLFDKEGNVVEVGDDGNIAHIDSKDGMLNHYAFEDGFSDGTIDGLIPKKKMGRPRKEFVCFHEMFLKSALQLAAKVKSFDLFATF